MSYKDRLEEHRRKIRETGLPPDLRAQESRRKRDLLEPLYQMLMGKRSDLSTIGIGLPHLIDGTENRDPHIQIGISQPFFAKWHVGIKIYAVERPDTFLVTVEGWDGNKSKIFLEYEKHLTEVEETLLTCRAAVPEGGSY
jgi:hypothetical protein